jgi:FkbM family methyltransferase
MVGRAEQLAVNDAALVLRALRRCVSYVPPRWRLACSYHLGLLGNCEPELRHLGRLTQPGGCAVDVGANLGLYAYAMARVHVEVHAFEPNPVVTRALQAWRNPRVHVHAVALASEQTTATLRIPVQDGMPLTGWASLGSGRLPSANSYEELQVTTKTLDEFALRDVRLIKIDVEGYEVEVLRGAAGTIERSRPVMVVEVDDGNQIAIARIAEEFGYTVTTLAELLGIVGSQQNRILVPTRG